MKKFIQTLRNIFTIDELRTRILNTLLFLLVYRFAAHVVLPGVDPEKLAGLQDQTSGGILGLLDMFAGGAFSQASVVALGIMPYISASIVVQLLGIAVPYFQKLQKEGESGRKRINQITRLLTVAVVIFQAPGYLINLRAQAPGALLTYADSPTFFMVSSTIIIIAGTLFIMWLGERITEKGLGNGISLIIMTGIIARLPFSLYKELESRLNSGGGLVVFLLEIVALFAIVVFVILLVQGTRKIPVQFAKKIVGNRQYGGVRQYIPLKVNAAGVMPIVFAQAIMFIPATLAQFYPESPGWQSFAQALSDFNSPWYNLIFALLIIVFTYFYTAIAVNPSQMADDMKKNGGFIPGVKPGRKTAEFIDEVMSRITFPGSLFLAAIAILPSLGKVAQVNTQFAQFFGGTSLLILVGVVLDTLQQIESHLLMRHYDGLMKSGRIKGRTAVGAAV
jgi:preprotein translocase subunit SecY